MMGMTLPGELVTFLNILGYNWPQGDEEKLFKMGERWMGFSGTLDKVTDGGHKAASGVWEQNQGANIQAFSDHFNAEDGPTKVLKNGSTASTLVGAGMIVVAGIVLALKINVIVQLVILAVETAQAIATAVVTFGASLAEIPIFQQISRAIVGELINQVIMQVLNA
jgi:hypothetical protein